MESVPTDSAEINYREDESCSTSPVAEAPSATSFEVVDKATCSRTSRPR